MTDITNTFSVKARKIKQKMNQITYENKDKITKLFQPGF